MYENQLTILSNLNIDKLNEMQVAAQDVIMNNEKTILLSPTGSGKTLAYLLPVLQLLDSNRGGIQCLVVVPSRELVLQIESVWRKMKTNFKVNVCYGGHSLETELNNLSNPPALLIGTPGRLKDHLERKSFSTDEIKILVLDEFDKSLQLGFLEDMEEILQHLSGLEKRILISATSDVELPEFIRMDPSVILDYTQNQKEKGLSVKVVLSPEKDKIETLFQLLCSINSDPALVFCNHREVAERVAGLLNEKGIHTGYYHGGMDQDDRERILIQFRNGSLNYLITTDLAARGLDIPEMKHVVHYHLPSKESEFVHRNGRTARMHALGTAYIIRYQEEKMPNYIPEELPFFEVNKNAPLPALPQFKTVYVSGGRKNKLNKSDIVGFFLQKGKLETSDLGLIEVKDFVSFVAVTANSVKKLLSNTKEEKMKGKKYKIEVARNVLKKID